MAEVGTKSLPAPLVQCIEELEKLQGIGHKSAQRILYGLLARGPEAFEALAQSLQAVPRLIDRCPECRAFREAGQPCALCQDSRRDRSSLCVVESASDLSLIEATGEFRGLYHVLGGLLSPSKGVRPKDLGLDDLPARIEAMGVSEVILATPPTAEGEATASYVASMISSPKVRVSRIGFGIPVGSDLQYSDSQTLSRSLAGRRDYK